MDPLDCTLPSFSFHSAPAAFPSNMPAHARRPGAFRHVGRLCPCPPLARPVCAVSVSAGCLKSQAARCTLGSLGRVVFRAPLRSGKGSGAAAAMLSKTGRLHYLSPLPCPRQAHALAPACGSRVHGCPAACTGARTSPPHLHATPSVLRRSFERVRHCRVRQVASTWSPADPRCNATHHIPTAVRPAPAHGAWWPLGPA